MITKKNMSTTLLSGQSDGYLVVDPFAYPHGNHRAIVA